MEDGGPAIGLRGNRVQNPERARERRREILDAAAGVFARLGYGHATLDDVAAQMGVSRGVIYYYFRNKEHLQTELVATASAEASERLEAIIARGDPPDVTLRAALRELATRQFEGMAHYASVVAGSGTERNQNWVTATRSARRRYRTLIRGIIESGIRAGVFVDLDPRLATLAILQTVLGTVQWYRPNGDLPPEIIVEQMVEFAMRGILRC
jgi:AcrR family transcriptional regulator